MSNSIAERLGLTDEVKEIKIGKSFKPSGNTYFHTLRYDFKPASVDPKKTATIDIGEGNQATVTVPHVDKGSGSTHTVFKGSKKPYQKECVLIIDHETGEVQLERLTFNLTVKKTRAEGSSKIKPTAIENHAPPNSKKSPVQKLSPQQKCIWPSNHYSPVPKCSPLPKSPNSQSSPPSQTSPTVPSVVPPTSNTVSNSRHLFQVPPQDGNSLFPPSSGETDMFAPPIGVLLTTSGSSSDDSSSGSSSESESSDEETGNSSTIIVDKPDSIDYSSQKYLLNGSANSPQQVKMDSQPTASVLPNMPQLSQLSRDLQLSSESDSD